MGWKEMIHTHYLITHLLAYQVTNSLTHSLAHSFCCSLTHSRTCLLAYSLTRSLTHSSPRNLACPFVSASLLRHHWQRAEVGKGAWHDIYRERRPCGHLHSGSSRRVKRKFNKKICILLKKETGEHWRHLHSSCVKHGCKANLEQANSAHCCITAVVSMVTEHSARLSWWGCSPWWGLSEWDGQFIFLWLSGTDCCLTLVGTVACSGHTRPGGVFHNKRISEYVPRSHEVTQWCSEPQKRLSADWLIIRWFKRESIQTIVIFCRHEQLLLLQMSNYKRATLEEEDVSDIPGEAASSPDRVEVCTCSRTVTNKCFQQFECLCVSQVGFRKGGVDALGRRTRLEVLLLVLLLVTLLALLACLLVLGLGFHSGTRRRSLVRH